MGNRADKVVERATEGYGYLMFGAMALGGLVLAVLLVLGAGDIAWQHLRPAHHHGGPTGYITPVPTTVPPPFVTTTP